MISPPFVGPNQLFDDLVSHLAVFSDRSRNLGLSLHGMTVAVRRCSDGSSQTRDHHIDDLHRSAVLRPLRIEMLL